MLYPVEEVADLVFREQADGRKVCRLLSGKMVLIHWEFKEQVKNGEKWRVRLEHSDMYAVAYPMERLEAPPPPPPAPSGEPVRNMRSWRKSLRTQVVMPEVKQEAEADAAPAPKPAAPVALPTVVTKTEAVIEKAEKKAPTGPVLPADLVRSGERVAVFVDAANLEYACRDVKFWVDYRKLLGFCKGGGNLYAAYYFVADFTQDEDQGQRAFLDALNHAGYVIRLKRVKRIIDRETFEESIKANVDTELVIEMLNTMENYDVAFLLSGDSDYERLVDVLRSRGKRIYVVSSRNTLSRELAYVADQPIYRLEEIRDHVERITA